MAGEQLGQFYEHLTVIALERALAEAGVVEPVVWNPPAGECSLCQHE